MMLLLLKNNNKAVKYLNKASRLLFLFGGFFILISFIGLFLFNHNKSERITNLTAQVDSLKKIAKPNNIINISTDSKRVSSLPTADTTISMSEYYSLVSQATTTIIDSTKPNKHGLNIGFNWGIDKVDTSKFYISASNSKDTYKYSKVIYICLDGTYQMEVTDKVKRFQSEWSSSKNGTKFLIFMHYKDGKIVSGYLNTSNKSNYFIYLTK